MNNYKSSLTIVVGFVLLSTYFNNKILFSIGISIGILGLISEKINDIIILVWNKLSEILGKIMPNVLLTAVYYLFLTPIALINRMNSKKNMLQLKNNSSSVYIHQKKEFSNESLEKIW